MVERIETGIPGLDKLIEGGFPEGSVTLISGGAGCGKTIFCSQFLWHGLEQGENCLFVTLEEEPDAIKDDALEFGWDFEQYEDSGEYFLMYMNPFNDLGGFVDRIRAKVADNDVDRVVLDSTSVIGMYEDNTGRIRERLYDLVRKLRKTGATSVSTTEIPRGSNGAISRYGVEEFVADGVIVLRGLGVGGEMGRRVVIEKMRRTDFEEDIFPLEIGDNGITIHEPEKGISL